MIGFLALAAIFFVGLAVGGPARWPGIYALDPTPAHYDYDRRMFGFIAVVLFGIALAAVASVLRAEKP